MSTPHSSVLERIDQICDRYEAARLAGQRPRIDDYLREVTEAERSGLLHELLRLERAYLQDDQRRRWQQGERVLVQAYLEETPSLRNQPELVFELVCGEVLLREEQGEKPRPVDYLDLVPSHQAQLRRFFAARDLLPPATLPARSDPLTLLAAKRVSVVEADHTVDEMPPLASAPTPAPPATERPTALGETVLAPPGYEILGELGRGGMGVVYQARQVNADRLVALKMILAGGHAEPDQRARFRTEAEAIARLQHPHVVQIFEVGEHNGLPFFSMEFCPGGSLDKKLAGTPLPPKEAAALVETLAKAMQAAHEKGVVHRDLKPANVLLVADGTAKVTDFGLAKKLDEVGQTVTGEVMGTPSYMAPEQAGGHKEQISPKTDVYALGAILYECLTGRPPFRAASLMDTLQQVITAQPVPPRAFQPNLSRDLETVCLKCLNKEPARRYATAEALANELRRFLAGEPVQARPPSIPALLRWWLRQNFGAFGWTVVIGLMFGLLCGLMPWLSLLFEAAQKVMRLEVYLLMAFVLSSTGLGTVLLVRPKDRAADIAAGAITGLIGGVTMFTLSLAWVMIILTAVEPFDDDLRLLTNTAIYFPNYGDDRQKLWDKYPEVLRPYLDQQTVPLHSHYSQRGNALYREIRKDITKRIAIGIWLGMLIVVIYAELGCVCTTIAAGALMRRYGKLRAALLPYLEVAVVISALTGLLFAILLYIFTPSKNEAQYTNFFLILPFWFALFGILLTWKKSFQHARRLFRVTRLLVLYACGMLTARCYRAEGHVADALRIEARCQAIYEQLPVLKSLILHYLNRSPINIAVVITFSLVVYWAVRVLPSYLTYFFNFPDRHISMDLLICLLGLAITGMLRGWDWSIRLLLHLGWLMSVFVNYYFVLD
jgi:predicted Ser/Thr protein kinase